MTHTIAKTFGPFESNEGKEIVWNTQKKAYHREDEQNSDSSFLIRRLKIPVEKLIQCEGERF